MRSNNSGQTFFFIIMFFVLSGMFKGGGFAFLPFILFFIVFNSIRTAKKDKKGRGHVKESTRRRRKEYDRDRRERGRGRRDYERARSSQRKRDASRTRTASTKNPFKKSGVDKFKDYDYDGAIEDFTRALQIDNRDPSVYFNLACAYSLTEQKDLAFEALARSFSFGFNDTEKVKTHDALAYLRVQDEFETFINGGYKWPLSGKPSSNNMGNPENSLLLQQLKQLAELREKGLLTDAEFLAQKKKLLR